MSHIPERSSPAILFHPEKLKKQKFCNICESSHHMTKNHNQYLQNYLHVQRKSSVENEYDTIMSTILINISE